MEFRDTESLRFNEERHEYTLDNGRPLVSVTTVLKHAGVYGEYDSVPPEILKRAGEIGTEVHDKIERHLKYGEPLSSDNRSVQSYLKSFGNFNLLDLLTTSHTEVRLFHPDLYYAGTIDWLGWIHGELSIIDWKTTNKLNHEAVELQTAAYAELVRVNLAEPVESPIRRYALHLDKKGGFTLHKFTDPLAFSEFVRLFEKLDLYGDF